MSVRQRSPVILPMFFIVTTGRSGSLTAAVALSQSPDCICLHEPKPTLIKEATLCQYGILPEENVRRILLATRHPVVNGKVYGESNQKLAYIIPVLASAFPDARFIWLVRDGRDVVASTHYGLEWYKPLSELKHRSIALVSEWFEYRLRADKLGEMSAADWEALPRFEKNCWLWARTNQIVREHLHALPATRSMLVRLEDLFDRLGAICEFVGITPPPQSRRLRSNASPVKPKYWPDWPADEKAAFTRHCGAMMDELYPGWRDAEGRWQPLANVSQTAG